MCEKELETEQNCNILTPTLLAISVSFPFSWAAQPGAGCWFSLPHLISNSSDPQLINRELEGSLCWLMAFSTTSFLQLVWSPTCLISNWLIESLRGAGFLYRILSPTRLIPNSSDLQLINREPEGSLCWVLAFSTAPCLQLIECTELYNSSTPTFW